jgi:hypothetical protein
LSSRALHRPVKHPRPARSVIALLPLFFCAGHAALPYVRPALWRRSYRSFARMLYVSIVDASHSDNFGSHRVGGGRYALRRYVTAPRPKIRTRAKKVSRWSSKGGCPSFSLPWCLYRASVSLCGPMSVGESLVRGIASPVRAKPCPSEPSSEPGHRQDDDALAGRPGSRCRPLLSRLWWRWERA